MIVRVYGKKIKTTYWVEPNSHQERKNGEMRFVFDKKPELKFDEEEIGWEEICSYDGDGHEASWKNELTFSFDPIIYINEEEAVHVIKTKFRADLGEIHRYTDKIIENEEINKVEAENKLAKLMRTYNRQIAEENPAIKKYCEVHQIKVEDVDIDELKEIVCKSSISVGTGTVKIANIPTINYITTSTTSGWGNII